MSNALKQLTEKRQRWVEANRENGFEDGIKRLLTDLYPDNAHFIYELLQNAEDARDRNLPVSRGASTVRFTLNNDSIEFEHDGDMLFSLNNVESITSIGASTKRDDPTSIGKFGVGFKAVFAYTNTPEIHSGEFHFRIHDLVVPETNGVTKPVMGDRETRFIFPFDHPTKRPEQAVAEVERALRDLGDNTLLFLSHIHTVEYLLPDGSLGYLKRIEHEKGRIEIQARDPDGKDTVSHWLRFQKDVEVADEDSKTKTCRIAIAYRLEEANDKEKRSFAWKIVPLDHGQVSIYFPAEKETSNLRFHLHAPFASTVARDSVRECKANRTLIQTIAELTASSLERLRDLDSLNVASYSALPLRAQDFPEGSLFRPIYDKVREAFKTQRLLPAHDGSFVCASEAKRTGEKLAELFSPKQGISPEQLGALFGKPELFWLHQDITGDLHTYLAGLAEGLEVRPETLAAKLTTEFFAQQPIAWFVSFIPYAMQNASLKKTSFIRLENGEQVALPSDQTAQRTAWFAPQDTANLDLSVFPLVHHDLVADGDVRKLLEKEGIREIDAAAIVEKCILPLYNGMGTPFDEPNYRDHLRQIRKAYTGANDAAKKQLTTNLDGAAWLACIHASGNVQDKIVWKKPGVPDVFTRTDVHETWFHGLDSVGAYFLHPSVNDELIDSAPSLVKPATVLTQNLHSSEYTVSLCKESYGNHKQGLNGFKPDATVVGLQSAFDGRNKERTSILWKIILSAPRIVSGETQSGSNRQRLDAAPKKLEYTEVGKLCRDRAWLPDKNGEWRKPCELFLSDLPDEFDTTSVRAKEVADKLGMKRPVSSETIEALGFSSEDELREAQAIVQSPDEFREFNEFKRRRQEEANSKPALPNKTSPDPKRREEKIAKEARNTPEKTQETRARTVDPEYSGAQDDARAYLKHQYTNDDGVMFCQLCQAPQPVMLNGEPHFEAVDCVGGINAHHEQNNLALCPNHAAMYKNGNLTPVVVQRAILESESQKIPLNLAGNEVELYFTQQHLDDLRAVLETRSSVPEI